MKITFFSDTHTFHKSVNIKECDVLCFTGDLTSSGEISTVVDFLGWFSKQPAKHKIYIAGNHDISHEKSKSTIKYINGLYAGIHYLHDAEVTIDGVVFYGSPYQPWFHNWAFNLQRGEELKNKWEKIPENTNVLLTHGPPCDILDITPTGDRAGCEDLRDRIKELKRLKIHAFGHIHHSYGKKKKNKVIYINSCVCTEQYKPLNKPITVEI